MVTARPTIVCAIEESETARQAAVVARDLAERLRLRLLLVHVVPGGAASDGQTSEETAQRRERERKRGEGLLLDVVVEEHLGRDAERRVAFGDPAESVAEIALAEAAEFIVVGSRGRGPLKSALLGSVSAALAASAPCPVIVVPPRRGRG